MAWFSRNLKSAVAALALLGGPALGEEDRLADLFSALQVAEGQDAQQIVGKILSEWAESGSPTMDLLLKRGREAMDAGDFKAAIGHLTALIDHAPGFAEGYNARASAYHRAGLTGPSLADLRMALALNPRHFGAMVGLGVIFEEIDAPDAALAAFRELERLYPASPEAAAAIPRLERIVEGRRL